MEVQEILTGLDQVQPIYNNKDIIEESVYYSIIKYHMLALLISLSIFIIFILL